MPPLPYTLKKNLGQHFLHDENICRKITTHIPTEGNLLEVGPGAGALTKYLLGMEHINFKAIELDLEKVQYLLQQYPEIEGKLIHEDFLKAPPPFTGSFNIVGNFPYNISGPILFRIFEWEPQVTTVVGMFQKEVARRISSSKGSKEYGILSVLLQAFYTIEYLLNVPPSCFTPAPKVVSGVVKLTKNNNPYGIKAPSKFKIFVKAAFGQRRKKLRNALSALITPELIPEPFAQKRAEQLSVAEFVHLFKTLFE